MPALFRGVRKTQLAAHPSMAVTGTISVSVNLANCAWMRRTVSMSVSRRSDGFAWRRACDGSACRLSPTFSTPGNARAAQAPPRALQH